MQPAASAEGVHIERGQVRLAKPIKTLGIVSVRVALHPDVSASIDINIARSEDEAERQARGENVLARVDEIDEETEGEEDQSAEFFDENAQAPVEDGDAEKVEEAGAETGV